MENLICCENLIEINTKSLNENDIVIIKNKSVLDILKAVKHDNHFIVFLKRQININDITLHLDHSNQNTILFSDEQNNLILQYIINIPSFMVKQFTVKNDHIISKCIIDNLYIKCSQQKIIELNNFYLKICINNDISRESYHWCKTIDYYLMEKNTTQTFSFQPTNIDDFISFLKKYDNTSSFIEEYLIPNTSSIKNLRNNKEKLFNYIKNLISNISTENTTFNYNSIFNEILRFYKTIHENNNFKSYLSDLDSSYKQKADIEKININTTQKDEDIFLRETESIIEKNIIPIDIYTGQLKNNKKTTYHIKYQDSESIIINDRSNIYFIKHNNIYIKANFEEEKYILEKIELINKLSDDY